MSVSSHSWHINVVVSNSIVRDQCTTVIGAGKLDRISVDCFKRRQEGLSFMNNDSLVVVISRSCELWVDRRVNPGVAAEEGEVHVVRVIDVVVDSLHRRLDA